MRVVFAAALVFLLLGGNAPAATVEGIVYGPDLQPISAVLGVNTQPRQTLVAANGSYSLQLPKGEFELTAVSAENASLSGREKVRIVGDEGSYAIDFILLGDDAGELADALRELEEVAGLEDDGLPEEEPAGVNLVAAAVLALALLAAIAFAYWRMRAGKREEKGEEKTREAEEVREQKPVQAPQSFSQDEKEVLAKLAGAGGLLSQKDLRKALPFWSEARASLVVSALEKQGKLKSFKQGRGNILKLLE